MRASTETQPSDVAQPPPSPKSGAVARLRQVLPSLVVVAVAGGLVAAFFLGLYWAKHYDMPIGWDTPRYLDQTNLVAAHGLAGVPNELPPPIKTLPSRGGTPVVLLTLSSLFGVSTFAIAAVVPPAAAAALALAAGAVVTWTLRRGPWSLAAVALLVGTSAVVIRLMAPETYADNLFAAAILTAALVPVLASAVGGGGFVAAVILIGAGAIAHSPSFAVVALALVLGALMLLPGSVRSWRRGELTPLATPSARIAGAVVGGGAIAAAATFGVLRAAPDTPKLSRGELIKKLRDDVPLYRYWLTVPLAAIGALALWRAPWVTGGNGDVPEVGSGDARPRPERPRAARILLLFLSSWVAIALAGVALYLAGRSSPAHRFLAFLIPLPILVAAGALWLGRLAATRAGRAVGAAVVGAAVLVLGGLGYHDLYTTLAGPARGVEWLDAGKVQDAATAAAYLEAAGVPTDAPVVFVMDDRGPNPLSYVPEMTYMLRAVLPADRVPHAYVYVGDPANFVAGKPTYRAWPRTYDANANRFWPTIQTLLAGRPVALLLSSYNPAYRAFAAAHPDAIVAPNVVALSGPKPPTSVAAPPIPRGPRGAAQGALLGCGVLVAMTLVGLGWSFGSAPGGVRPFEAFALAPAFGFAFLILGGIAADALGLRLVGLGGGLTPVVVAVAGGAFALVRARGRRSLGPATATLDAGVGGAS